MIQTSEKRAEKGNREIGGKQCLSRKIQAAEREEMLFRWEKERKW